jgi:hypothetical protein
MHEFSLCSTMMSLSRSTEPIFVAISATRECLTRSLSMARSHVKEKEDGTAEWEAAVRELNALDERHLRMQHALYTVDVSSWGRVGVVLRKFEVDCELIRCNSLLSPPLPSSVMILRGLRNGG